MPDVAEPVVFRVDEHVVGFYLGRDHTPPSPYARVEGNWVDGGAWKLGGASYVVHSGDEALVYDTTTVPEGGRFVRDYVERELGARRITVVLSHWHLDHIAGNAAFRDCPLVARTATRDAMVENAAAIEAGELWGPPALEVVLPNATFEGSLACHVGDVRCEFHPFDIHSRDGNVLLLPEKRLLFPGDTLEDSVTYVIEPEGIPTHVEELGRLARLPFERIYPNHGRLELLRDGGYGPTLIDAMAEYDRALLARVDEPDFLDLPIEAFVPEGLARGDVAIWEPYREVHANSLRLVRETFGRAAAGA